MIKMTTNFYKALLIFLLVLVGLCTTTSFTTKVEAAAPTAVESVLEAEQAQALDAAQFNKNMDIWFMLMLVAFLMMFIRKFEWGIGLAVLLTAASGYVTYLAFAEMKLSYYAALDPAWEMLWDQSILIEAVACAITAVIAIGVFIGTVKSWQYILVGVVFTPCYVLMQCILFAWFPLWFGSGIMDPGGGISVHFFAAYWGLGAMLAIREKRAFNEPMYTSKHGITFVWLASLLLFILWPSFVTALSSREMSTGIMVNCYMSGMGSILSAYFTMVVATKKVNPLIFLYTLLAGPVASSSSLTLATPWFSLGIGVVAGIVCTLAFLYLQGWFCGKLGILDVMGVHNLHGVGGWLSLLFGALLVGNAINIAAGVVTLTVGIVTGFLTGCIIKATRGVIQDEDIMNDDADFSGYNPQPEVKTDGLQGGTYTA